MRIIFALFITAFITACEENPRFGSEHVSMDRMGFIHITMNETEVEEFFTERKLGNDPQDFTCTRSLMNSTIFLQKDGKPFIGKIVCMEKTWFIKNQIIFNIFKEERGATQPATWKTPLVEI